MESKAFAHLKAIGGTVADRRIIDMGGGRS